MYTYKLLSLQNLHTYHIYRPISLSVKSINDNTTQRLFTKVITLSLFKKFIYATRIAHEMEEE